MPNKYKETLKGGEEKAGWSGPWDLRKHTGEMLGFLFATLTVFRHSAEESNNLEVPMDTNNKSPHKRLSSLTTGMEKEQPITIENL